jgi:hypothetical protein
MILCSTKVILLVIVLGQSKSRALGDVQLVSVIGTLFPNGGDLHVSRFQKLKVERYDLANHILFWLLLVHLFQQNLNIFQWVG